MNSRESHLDTVVVIWLCLLSTHLRRQANDYKCQYRGSTALLGSKFSLCVSKFSLCVILHKDQVLSTDDIQWKAAT